MRHNQEFALDTAKAVAVALAGNPALSAGKDCSWECAACKECLNCISLAFASDQEPDRFRSPLDPRLLPAWKA